LIFTIKINSCLIKSVLLIFLLKPLRDKRKDPKRKGHKRKTITEQLDYITDKKKIQFSCSDNRIWPFFHQTHSSHQTLE